MTYNPNSRFQVVDTLALGPGETVPTRSIEGPFIDTGVDLNVQGKPMFRGRVYLSKGEVHEMAEQLGLFDISAMQTASAIGDLDRIARESYESGYAAGYAEKVDATAAELVERMRARVQRDRDGGGDAGPAADAEGAGDAAVAGAEAAVGEGRDDVPSAEPAGRAKR